MREDRDDRPRIPLRSFVPRGRLRARFSKGVIAGHGAERTSNAMEVVAATPGEIREVVATTIGVWDSSGAQGRFELARIMHRARR